LNFIELENGLEN